MTTPIDSTTTSPPITGAAAQTSSSDATKDMFMKLLVAQLKYQNPMSPTDSTQYTQQMAIFSEVEKLDQLVQMQTQQQTWQQKVTAEGLVGKSVTGTDSDKNVHSGVVTKVSFDGATPELTLADGSTVAVGDVSSVDAASATTP